MAASESRRQQIARRGVKTHIPPGSSHLSSRHAYRTGESGTVGGLEGPAPSRQQPDQTVGDDMEHINVITQGHTQVQMYRGYPVHLTPRQREVLLLLCEGLCNKRIGQRLGLSCTTVKSHVAGLLRALNVTTRLEAAAAAREIGLAPATPRRSSQWPSSDTPRVVAPPTRNIEYVNEAMHLEFA